MRLGDFEYSYLEERVPAFGKTSYLQILESVSGSKWSDLHSAYGRYTPPDLDILLLLPCAAKNLTQSHKVHTTLGKYRKFVHEVIITSPWESFPEANLPAAHYDTAVTGHWDEEKTRLP